MSDSMGCVLRQCIRNACSAVLCMGRLQMFSICCQDEKGSRGNDANLYFHDSDSAIPDGNEG